MSPDSLCDVAPAPVPVAGVVPFSSVDWPGALAATLFLQGCPWRCPYCHNPVLRDAAKCGDVGAAAHDLEWRGVLDLLGERRGLLDAVVFTGGEPTMHRGLGTAIDAVHDMGFAVGLHTSGCYPEALGRIVRDHRPEWIGLDVKADPRDAQAYARVAYGGGEAGRGFAPAQLAAGAKVLRSLEIVAGAMMGAAPGAMAGAEPVPDGAGARRPALEVRTTVWPDSPAVAGVPGIADVLAGVAAEVGAEPGAELDGKAAFTWAIQKARPDGVSPDAEAAAGFRADRPGWADEFDELVAGARERLRGTSVAVIGR